METNYFGALRCIKAVLPQMRQRRSGTIINISSVAGSFSQPPMTAYCASKWALEAMSESLACEMKMFGVRVAVVKPGIIDTAMAQRISTTAHSEYPHAARIASFFATTLQNAPVPPSLVAQKVFRNRHQWHMAVTSSGRPGRRAVDRATKNNDRRTVDRFALLG
jgi:NAD(P)-dependent dehydrogenase (short-subunit alcohol dehydrogenase family)